MTVQLISKTMTAALLVLAALFASAPGHAQQTPPPGLMSMEIGIYDIETGETLVADGETYRLTPATEFIDIRTFRKDEVWQQAGTTVKIQSREPKEGETFPVAEKVWILRSPTQY